MPCGVTEVKTQGWGGRAAPGNKKGHPGGPPEPGGLSQKQERTPSRAWGGLSQKQEDPHRAWGHLSQKQGRRHLGMTSPGGGPQVPGRGQRQGARPPWPPPGSGYVLPFVSGAWDPDPWLRAARPDPVGQGVCGNLPGSCPGPWVPGGLLSFCRSESPPGHRHRVPLWL